MAKIDNGQEDITTNMETDNEIKNNQSDIDKNDIKNEPNDKCIIEHKNGEEPMDSNTETPMDVDGAKKVDTPQINDKTDEKNSNSDEINNTTKTADTLPTKNNLENEKNDNEMIDVVEQKTNEDIKVTTQNENSKHSNNIEDEKIETNSVSTSDNQELKSNNIETEVNKKTEKNVSEMNGSDVDNVTAKSNAKTSESIKADNETESKTKEITENLDNNMKNNTTENIKEQIKAVENNDKCVSNDKPLEVATKNENCTLKSEMCDTNIDKTTNGDNIIDNKKMDTEDNEKIELQKDVSDAKEIIQPKTISDEKLNGESMNNDNIEKNISTESTKLNENGLVAMDTINVSESTHEKNEDVIKPSDCDGVSEKNIVTEPEIKPSLVNADKPIESNNVNPVSTTKTDVMETNEITVTESEINNKNNDEKMLTDNDDVTEKTNNLVETKSDDIVIPVINCESSNAKQESANTTHTSESRETIEKHTDTNKEKISRVEITIEQTDKQLGQTTQTTTHIVKEISITEQLVCGNKSLSKESVNAKEIEIEIQTGVQEETANADPKTSSEKLENEIRENGNIEKVTETNGNDDKKEGNDSDKENDEGEKSTPLNGESKDSANEIVVKKCPDVLTDAPDDAASGVTESTTTAHLIQSES